MLTTCQLVQHWFTKVTVLTLTLLTLTVTRQYICQESLHQIQAGGLLHPVRVLLNGCEQRNKQIQAPNEAQATPSKGMGRLPCSSMVLFPRTMGVCLCRDTRTGTSSCFQAPARTQLQTATYGKLCALLHTLNSAVCIFCREMSTGTSRCYQAFAKAQSQAIACGKLYAVLHNLTSSLCRFAGMMSSGTSGCFQAPAKTQSQAAACGKLHALPHTLTSSVCRPAGMLSTGTSRCFQAFATAQSHAAACGKPYAQILILTLSVALSQGDEYWNKQMLSGPCQSTEQAATCRKCHAWHNTEDHSATHLWLRWCPLWYVLLPYSI